jgi:phosphatidylserine/phosphatidylglycerophosphate/cardiolipin synthase-like enzyme
MVAQLGREGAAAVLDAVAAERKQAESMADKRIELVWSGPEREGAGSRDTAALIRELFKSADHSVDVSGYAVYDGESIFSVLAQRMRDVPELSVRLFINVHRPAGDSRPARAIVEQHRERFFQQHWPWERRPEVYYDPRSLDPNPETRAVLHAKCVIVDERCALVTSANLTEAAQYRNIEAGVLVNDHLFVAKLRQQFRGLLEMRLLARLDSR